MYNQLYEYLANEIYSKQIAEHAATQSLDQIYESFENNDSTHCVFKVFGTAEHKILLESLRYSELKKQILAG